MRVILENVPPRAISEGVPLRALCPNSAANSAHGEKWKMQLSKHGGYYTCLIEDQGVFHAFAFYRYCSRVDEISKGGRRRLNPHGVQMAADRAPPHASFYGWSAHLYGAKGDELESYEVWTHEEVLLEEVDSSMSCHSPFRAQRILKTLTDSY